MATRAPASLGEGCGKLWHRTRSIVCGNQGVELRLLSYCGVYLILGMPECVFRQLRMWSEHQEPDLRQATCTCTFVLHCKLQACLWWWRLGFLCVVIAYDLMVRG